MQWTFKCILAHNGLPWYHQYTFNSNRKHHGFSKRNLVPQSSVSFQRNAEPDVTQKLDNLYDSFESENEEDQPSKVTKSDVRGQGITNAQIICVYATHVINLNHVLAPVIEEFPQETQMIEGQEISFKVVVTGYPPPKLQWHHNGEKIAEDYSTELDQDGSLHIPSSEKRHSGVYKLVASNSSGSAEKEVELKVFDEGEAPPPKDVDLSPVPVMEFGSFVAKNHKNSNAGFKDMYQVCKRINHFFINLFQMF